MVARRVARYAGTQVSAGAALTADADQTNQTSASSVITPEEILRRAHANSVAGVIDQIAQVAAHALEIFTELRSESDRLSDRFRGLADRVDVVAAVVLDERNSAAAKRHAIPPPDISDRILHVPELSFPTAPRPLTRGMQEARGRCEPLPPFDVFAEFCPDMTQYRKKYSNPEFFKEDWMQRETFRQQHDEQQRDERRRHRKEQRKSLVLAAAAVVSNQVGDDGQGTAVGVMDSGDGEKEQLAVQQKLKFLNIRSWKERYGTGEGKELLKPLEPKDSKQLPAALTGSSGDDTKKRRSLSRKSRSHVKDVEEGAHRDARESEEGAGTIVLAGGDSTLASPTRRSSVGVSDVPHSGAFMQEIEDPGEEFEDLDEFHDAHASAMATVVGEATTVQAGGVADAQFADHGLSYFDPHAPESPPPPPPPPPTDEAGYEEEEEDAWADRAPPPPPPPPSLSMSLSMDYEEVDEFQSPPPPPPPPPPPSSDTDVSVPRRRGSFAPPPPPPRPPPPQVSTERARGSNFLQELQVKRSALRAVESTDEHPPPPPPPSELLSPRTNLLEQIRMQQLRPVAARPPRPSAPLLARASAPFASSIARMLERREMTAYDSDSSDPSDANDSDSDDWK